MSRLWRSPHPGWIVAALLLLVLIAAVLGDNGILSLWRLRAELESLHRDVQGLEAENERLSRAIAELRHNPEAMERLAREELGLVRPGERVLQFPRTADTPPPPEPLVVPGRPAP